MIISHGFRINESDKCVYYKFIDNICTIICLYVDDLLIFGSHIDVVNKVKNLLRQNFDPVTLEEAYKSYDSELWQEAVNDEMDSLQSNKTWKLVDLPTGCKTIGCKWVLKRKLKADGSVEKYKARLVAKGFRQKENIDFFDTYSSVTRITSIHVLFAIVVIHDFIIHQMDIKTTFLNGVLEE